MDQRGQGHQRKRKTKERRRSQKNIAILFTLKVNRWGGTAPADHVHDDTESDHVHGATEFKDHFLLFGLCFIPEGDWKDGREDHWEIGSINSECDNVDDCCILMWKDAHSRG